MVRPEPLVEENQGIRYVQELSYAPLMKTSPDIKEAISGDNQEPRIPLSFLWREKKNKPNDSSKLLVGKDEGRKGNHFQRFCSNNKILLKKGCVHKKEI